MSRFVTSGSRASLPAKARSRADQRLFSLRISKRAAIRDLRQALEDLWLTSLTRETYPIAPLRTSLRQVLERFKK